MFWSNKLLLEFCFLPQHVLALPGPLTWGGETRLSFSDSFRVAARKECLGWQEWQVGTVGLQPAVDADGRRWYVR